MRSVGSILLRSTTCCELMSNWLIFIGYSIYLISLKFVALLYMVTDLPQWGPFSRPEFSWPPPLGGNTKCRPIMALIKLITVTIIGYLAFLVVNLVQLELIGKYELSVCCILTLNGCKPNFMIGEQTKHITKAKFVLINSLLKKHGMALEGGDLVALDNDLTPVTKPPGNMSSAEVRVQDWEKRKKNDRNKSG